LYFRVIALAGSGNATLCTLLVAPVAIVLGAVVLGESLPPNAYIGFGLIALGLIVIDGRLWKKMRR
jgi:drug/metabolite transporter (DMT)-like permease